MTNYTLVIVFILDMLVMRSGSHSEKSYKTKKVIPLSYRCDVVLRFILALLGGYALSSYFSLVFSLILPGDKVYAVLTATMLSFILHALIFIFVFAVRSVLKVWLGIIIPLVLFIITYNFLKG